MPRLQARAVGLGAGPGGEKGHRIEGLEEAMAEPGPEGRGDVKTRPLPMEGGSHRSRGAVWGGLGQGSQVHGERHRDGV